ncbi:MAG: MFS transporter [Verrucomicrobiota bacterium]|nr:MFS transporter [Verrucomicrobiota bacterium]
MKKPSLLIIFLTVFIDLIGFGIVLPLLPKYCEIFGAKSYQIGLVIGSFSLMQFIFAPAWGRLSDRIGRRPVLLIGNAGSALSYALFAVAANFPATKGLFILLASRIFAGICGATLSVASAYIADITERENRSKSMGLIGMAFGLGFIFGPALGAFSAARFGFAGPGWVASIFCAGNFLLGCIILKESRKPNSEHAPQRPRWEQWIHTLRHPKLGFLIGIFFLATYCFTCFESTLPLLVSSSLIHRDEIKNSANLAAKLREGADPISTRLRSQFPFAFLEKLKSAQAEKFSSGRFKKDLTDRLNELIRSPNLFDAKTISDLQLNGRTNSKVEGATLIHANRLVLEKTYPEEISSQKIYYDEKHLGYLFAFCGLIAAFIQGGAIGKLIKKFGDQRLIAGSLIFVAISLCLIPYMGSTAGLLAALGLFAAGSGINRAPTMGQISLNSSVEEQGATLGVAQSVGTLARIIGPVFATGLFYVYKPLPYVVAAGVALVAGILAWRLLVRPN